MVGPLRWQHGALSLSSLLAATNQFSILISQKMQLIGWRNGNEMRNAICMAHKLQLSGCTVYSLYCGCKTGFFTFSRAINRPVS